jgi:ABC-type phosphate/phosphonate transport system ATPase subunit
VTVIVCTIILTDKSSCLVVVIIIDFAGTSSLVKIMEEATAEAFRVELDVDAGEIMEDATTEISRVLLNFEDVDVKAELIRRVEVVSKMYARPVVDFVVTKLVFELEKADTVEDNAILLHKVMTHWVIIGFENGRIHKRLFCPLILN